jgi:hypothetical protein
LISDKINEISEYDEMQDMQSIEIDFENKQS